VVDITPVLVTPGVTQVVSAAPGSTIVISGFGLRETASFSFAIFDADTVPNEVGCDLVSTTGTEITCNINSTHPPQVADAFTASVSIEGHSFSATTMGFFSTSNWPHPVVCQLTHAFL